MESSFCVCLTPAISVLQSVPKWCRKEHKKNQVKKEPKSRPMMNLIARSNERAPSALSSTAPESPEKSRHESRSPLSSQAEKYDRTGNPLFARTRITSATDPLYTNTHQPTQNGTLLKIGLLKSWNLMDWWMIERWDPLFALKVERINSSLKTTERNQNCRSDPDHSCTRWTIKCEKGKKNPQ